MTTCLNCERMPIAGSVFCAEHCANAKPTKHAGARLFLISMIVTAMFAAVVTCCYFTAHALGFSWSSVFR